MALESLGKALHTALRKLTGGIVDEKLIDEINRDIQRALLSADVNVKMVFELTKNIKSRALDEKLPAGINRKEHVLHIVYEELTKILGQEARKIEIPRKPTILLLIGIQGSGKTTTCGKLARFFQKRGYKTGIVCTDTWRPGALRQLEQYVSETHIEVFGDESIKDATRLARQGLTHFQDKTLDILLVDTAGRHKEEHGLLEEMKQIAKVVNPDEVILVIDGTLGQQAFAQAEAFKKATPIGSIIVTKLDGSAKGGGALSAVAATGAPIKFITTGESINYLEEFDPKRFVGRLLGLGDIESLLHKVREASQATELSEKDAMKFMTGKFSLRDMYTQLEMISNMGPLQQVLQMIPGMGMQMPEEMVEMSEEKLAHFREIMDSMTEGELDDPKVIHASHIQRIARGSGRSEKEVRELLNQYNMMKNIFRQFGKKGRGKLPATLLKKFGVK